MKTFRYFVAILIAISMSATSFAQTHDHSKMATTKTETFKVSGNCESCKARIEKAAKIEGVVKADWNKKTKILVLTYDPSRVRSVDIQKRIADVGHDTPLFRAEAKTYNALPSCCKYR
ncbi:MAG: heavy-metal-associated domain-containing protein [Bacteroidota bacterium]|nr:heavy-metal-associated domain-containing protein [Bacteroidota bacterium]